MKKKPQKMFIVKKYIMASCAKEALRKDLKTPADDCWVDEDWKKEKQQLASAIGFSVPTNDDDD